MKFVLKLLLFMCIVITGIYASTPLWLSYVLTPQLPVGWQLEKLQHGYPGLSGIKINVLHVKAELQAADMFIAAADMHVNYQDLKTDIRSLEINIKTTRGGSADRLTLNDLSLPLVNLTAALPALSIGQLRAIVHHNMDILPGNPLLLDFQTLKLSPLANNGFHLSSGLGLAQSAALNGRLKLEVRPDSLKAEAGFATDSTAPPWLSLVFEQKDLGPKTTARLRVTLDTEPADQEWLDAALERNTNGMLTSMNGKLEAQADFSGKDFLDIKLLSLASEQLQLESADGIFSLGAQLLASREAEKVFVTLPEPAEFQYRDKTAESENEQNPPVTIAADLLSVEAELTLRDGKIISTGYGTLMNAHSTSPVTSVAKMDVTWRELDLLNLSGELSSKTTGFATEVNAETWTGFDFDVSYVLSPETGINGSGTMIFAAGPVLPIQFKENVQLKRWNITLSPSNIKLTQLSGLLAVAHFELPAAINMTDGFINIQGRVEAGDEITATMAIEGHEINISMLESGAREARFKLNTRYHKTISANGSLSIGVIALAGGVDVSHIRADLNLESLGSFALKNLYAEVFDGQLSTSSLRFAENMIEDTTLELKHINLGNLLAFVDIDGLEGTGSLDISLPAGSDETGMYIRNGTFNSLLPGRLAYTKEGVAGTNIGLQVLENFQYQGLSGTLDYQSDGAYRIGVRLEGKNPDLYEGHAIVFNLNISGLLPALFEALFITGDFEESILKQIGID